MGQMVLRCELCVVKTLHFQFFCDREELDAAYRWLQGRSEGSSLDDLWRQVEGARKWAVLQRTNEYVVLCIRKRHSQKSHVHFGSRATAGMSATCGPREWRLGGVVQGLTLPSRYRMRVIVIGCTSLAVSAPCR